MTTVESTSSVWSGPATQMVSGFKQSALGALVIAAAALAVYWPSLSGAFIMDDDRYLTANPLMSAPDGLFRFWFSSEQTDYYPVSNTTLWLEWRLWGMNPVGYHATNLALHIATCLLLWGILRKLFIPGAWLAALIYAIHPVNVEAVAWISQRKEILATLFLLLSILWYLNSQSQGKWYWASLAAFVGAILSKSSAATLPLLLLLIDWWLHGPIAKRTLLRVAPYFCIACLATPIQHWFHIRNGDPLRNADFAERLSGAGTVVWFYLSKAVAPIKLSFFYPQLNIQTGSLLFWLPLLAAAGVSLVLWRLRSDPWVRHLLFAWAFFCLALVPVMGFGEVGYMVHSLVSDVYQHVAIIGVIALFAAGGMYLHRHAISSAQWPVKILAVLVLSALTVLAWQRSRLYGNTIELFQATIADNPQSYLAEIDLAIALSRTGRIQDAMVHCRQAIRNAPTAPEGYNMLGNLLVDAGQSPAAVEQFRKALQLRPNYSEALNNLGIALRNLGRPQDAIDRFEQALQLNPFYADAHLNLGITLAQTGRLPEAGAHFEQAVRIRPDYDIAHNNLANALRHIGRTAEAIQHYQEAVRLNPDYAEAYLNLGNLLRDIGRFDEAVGQYQQALRVKPKDAAVYASLTKTYAALGRSADAIATAQTALALARTNGDTELAKQIDEWLTQYRAHQSTTPNAAP